MGIPSVKVVNPTESYVGTVCCIDGKQIHGVRSVDFRIAVDEVPQFTLETLGLPDIDMIGNVQFSFTPETVQQAVIFHEKYATCNECGDEVTVPSLDDENTKELENVCNGLKGCGLL